MQKVKFSSLMGWAKARRRAVILVVALGSIVIPAAVLYGRLWSTVNKKLRYGAFGNSISLYAAPQDLAVHDESNAAEVVAALRQSGYSESASNPMGHYRAEQDSIDIYPGPDSYFKPEAARISFQNGHIAAISAINDNGSRRDRYSLEPQLIVDLDGGEREKRRMVHFDEIPKVLVDALLAAEDKHFFQHQGVDPVRLVKAAWVNVKSGRKEQGGSTLTMQLARQLWLDSDKNWKRKATEFLIAMILEQKLSKKAIFEYYCNQIYLGRHEAYNVHGFGQAARIYFNKDISQINLTEAALLAGMVQRPSYFNPTKHPERMLARRNLVLALMRQNGSVTADAEKIAATAPLGLSSPAADREDAPYFLGLATEELQSRLSERQVEDGSYRVYTTLDQGLQRAAVEAVQIGMRSVDQLLSRKGAKAGSPKAQVALLALDAHTGEVRAVVGGRDYGASQLNHATSKRQPGSVFKPFVYAAALANQSANQTHNRSFTPASMLSDEPTTFHFGNTTYEPSNFGDHFHGRVTLREALAKSMNVATVSLAQQVGYGRVVDLAKRAGLNEDIQATPAVALGAYETTPLEIAGAYTVFANEGVYVKPAFVAEVRSARGRRLSRTEPQERTVLDPRVTFLMRDMLQEVIRSGTASDVRARGFNVPAAGKTGTSRDGWFAGFTSNLICVVWVGFDDNSDLDLEGARSALPIWTEFMKRATKNSDYALPFPAPPSGIVSLQIDPETGEPAGPACPYSRSEYFLAGSEPQGSCSRHSVAAPAESLAEVAFAK